MKLLGVRCSTKMVRYAVIQKNAGGEFIFENRETGNRLIFPAAIQDDLPKRLEWLHKEISRLCEYSGPFQKVCLKVGEFMGGDSNSKRITYYSDAVILLVAAQNNIPVETRLYKQLKTRSQIVMADAEKLIGCSSVHWDAQMADAIIVAMNGFE